ncbi:O-Antigen ligase [Caloramator mitchellensis]|uniref:O-Antigen ligase n=1 Tax=Caloramator mitchellensis TaxID=908809 RepID=A0A0R3JQZ4_CALMK|nr:O-antigen ligase family protein [Caloramator mitchellensis]KRQ85872.1 O-Antigen ligase [Caloramator mitchellensis]
MKKMPQKSEIYSIIPILLILVVVPLIVHLKVVDLTGEISNIWIQGKKNLDFFSYYKAKYFIIISLISCVVFFVKLSKNSLKIKKSFLYVPSFVFIMSALISTLLSEYSSIAFFGAPDRYEGFFVILFYILIMLLTFNLTDNDKKIYLLINALLVSTVIISIIAIFQYFKHDIFQTTLGRKLILPKEFWPQLDKLQFTLGERAAYGTLYNINYVGSFMAISFPLFLTLTFLLKDLKQKTVYAIAALLALSSLFASLSRAGLLGIVVSIMLLLFILRKYLFKQWKVLLSFSAVAVLAIIIINSVTNGFVLNRFATLKKEAKSFLTTSSNVSTKNRLKEIKTEKNTLTFIYKNDSLKFDLSDNLKIYDANNKEIKFDYNFEDSSIKFIDEQYKDRNFGFGNYNGMPLIQLRTGGSPINVVYTVEGFKIIGPNNSYLDVKPVEKIGFEGKEYLGSNRGYIWSRTLPLIKKKPLFGYGPDTFILSYPQHDVVGKLNFYYDPLIVLDKPHNIFIQTAVNTGLVSLIALLLIFALYILQSLKIYYNPTFEGINEIYGVSIFLGIVGYIITGFFNDSIVSVAPVFWVLLGVGFAVNYYISSKRQV